MTPCKPRPHLHCLAWGDGWALLPLVQPTKSTGALAVATCSEGAVVVPSLLSAGSVGNGHQYAMPHLQCGSTSGDAAEEAPNVVLGQEGDAVHQLKEGADVHHVAGQGGGRGWGTG